jgi:hypothetical protein
MLDFILSPIAEYLVYVIIFISAIISSYWAAYRHRNKAVDLINAPILLSYYTHGTHIIPAYKGKFGKMKYKAIVTVAKNLAGPNKTNDALLYMVELPFTTKLHLLGIPVGTGSVQLNPATGNSIMERVHLEGDYNKYFALFCEKGMQVQTRYIMDPAAMAFTLDFCLSHSWEIIGSELYFVQTSTSKVKNDPTFMHDDVEQFVKEIRPAIADDVESPEIATEDNKDLAPDKGSVSEYECPICQVKLIDKEDYFPCPNQHGLLVIGSKLPHIKEGLLPNPDSHKKRTTHEKLACPVCDAVMTHVPYGGSETIIDSCSKCPYRWVDAGELIPRSRLLQLNNVY